MFLIDALVAHFLSLLFRKHKFLLDGNRNSSNVVKVLEEYLLVQCQQNLVIISSNRIPLTIKTNLSCQTLSKALDILSATAR